LIKRSIHAIKYFHRRDLIEPLAEALVREYARYKDEELSKDTTLVPIPMPTMRKLLRGYNQAELLTNAIARSTSWQVDSHLLIRSKATKRQVAAKTRGERLKSQRNSFSVTRSVEGESILLVDDVATTGATLLEARKVLLDAGAKHVLAITIAH
jgi:ComF family protein